MFMLNLLDYEQHRSHGKDLANIIDSVIGLSRVINFPWLGVHLVAGCNNLGYKRYFSRL